MTSKIRGAALAALAVFATTTAAILPVQAASADTTTCPDTMVFEVGGVGNYNGSSIPALNRNNPSGTATTNINYSASIAPFGGTKTGNSSHLEGEAKLDTAVRTFRAQCPDSHITITGHSFGALVAGNVCDSYQTDPALNHNTNCVLYSDPRRPAGADGVGGVTGMLPSFIPGFNHQGQRPAATGPIPVAQVCNTNDGICYAPNPFVNPLGTLNATIGYIIGDHNAYYVPPQATPPGDNLANPAPYIPNVEAPAIVNEIVPTPYDLLEPVMDAVQPAAVPEVGAPYEATPLEQYLPPVVNQVLDLVPVVGDAIQQFVPPPLPPLPRIPGLP